MKTESQNVNSKEEINVYGSWLNQRFANKLLDTFSPTILRVVEQLVIDGKDEKAVTEAATTTARAIVAGIRELVKSHRSNQDSSHVEKEAQTGSIQQDRQTEPLIVEPQVGTQVHRTLHQSGSGNE